MTQRFEDLIEQHHDEIFAYLWRLVGNERQSDVALEVEDLTQEVFLRAFENFLRLRRNSNYRAWLYKIATNCAYAKLRQAKNRREKNLTLEITATDMTTSPASESIQKRLRALVDALPPKQRACLTMRYLQDLDYSEIGQIFDCTEESARANVYQAIRRLRAALEEDK
jgi:RNA polymerase sigma-70 factor (ECF subfamily)